MELPKRKHPRLKQFDYCAGGTFAVTICTKDKACALGRVVDGCEAYVSLSAMGRIVKESIDRIPVMYPGVVIHGSVVMPNHVHMLLEIPPENRISLMTVIRSTKAAATKQYGEPIWQSSFYEHIIRNREEGIRFLKYISENPKKWTLDPYFE